DHDCHASSRAFRHEILRTVETPRALQGRLHHWQDPYAPLRSRRLSRFDMRARPYLTSLNVLNHRAQARPREDAHALGDRIEPTFARATRRESRRRSESPRASTPST